MQKPAKAVENFLAGYACSQAILAEYGELFDLGREQALKLAAGFAGGMRIGSTCGSVIAAYMVMGLKFSGEDCGKLEGRKPVYEAMSDFNHRFTADNGSLNCRDLLGCDISSASGLETARQKDLFRTACPRFVRSAAELLDEILENG